MNAQRRPLVYAVIGIVAVWMLAIGGYTLASHWKMTAEKLRAYLLSTDLNSLSGAARAKAIHDLEDKINALSPGERQQARLGKLWAAWFNEMTEEEKSQFLDATLPSGFKQMLTTFEQLPQAKRQLAIDNAIRNLKSEREYASTNQSKTNSPNTNAPILSEDLQKQVAVIGLKSVYSGSSAQTKAELAPVLEEIQRSIESGHFNFNQPRRQSQGSGN